MSSRNDPSRRKSKWNSNEVCLAIISGIFGLLMLFAFVTVVRGPGGVGDALGGMLCVAVPGSVPMFMLWRSRRRGNKSRVMQHLVRSSSFTGHGFADVSITSEQATPLQTEGSDGYRSSAAVSKGGPPGLFTIRDAAAWITTGLDARPSHPPSPSGTAGTSTVTRGAVAEIRAT